MAELLEQISSGIWLAGKAGRETSGMWIPLVLSREGQHQIKSRPS